MQRRTAGMLAAGILSGLLLGFAVDYAFDYFFAIRQFLFLAPALVLFAVHGLLESRRRALAAALALLFLGGSLVRNYAQFTHPREDWAAAARLLRQVSGEGYCLASLTREEPQFYAVFEPSLERCQCSWPVRAERVALVSHLYSLTADRGRATANLTGAGYHVVTQRSVGGTTVSLYNRGM
jgi:hypothetical protein